MSGSDTAIDVLVVGQGLAGSLLAWELLERGVRVQVVDGGEAATSRTAAGLINPVTGRHLTLEADAAVLLAAARARYQGLEARFGRRLFHPRPMLRLLRTAAEQRAWEKRRLEPAYRPYLEPAALPPGIVAPRGGLRQQHAGFLDTNALLDTLGDHFAALGLVHRRRLDYGELEPAEEGVRWRGLVTRWVVFCEGWRALDNPWFGHLPLRPVKGEILTLASAEPLPEAIINAGRWLVPLGGGRLRLGATYENRVLDETPTAGARESLLATLPGLLDPSPRCRVEAQRAGVRPASADRRPLLGRHPEHPALALFNGFGSKGSLLIPWHAARMAEHLLHGAPLPAAADIVRFRPRPARHGTLSERAHAALAEALGEGDVALDATAGNGYDTLFLARRVGPGGQVHAFDIQPRALEAAARRLAEHGLQGCVSLHLAGHETLAERLPAALRLRAATFNLGFLPHGDHGVTTRPETTVPALAAAAGRLLPGGRISVMVYTGHAGGKAEAQAVAAWLAALPPGEWSVEEFRQGRSGGATLWLLERTGVLRRN